MFYSKVRFKFVLCQRANFDYIELVNSDCADDSTDLALATLLEAREVGKDLCIVGNTDAHRKDKLGYGYTMVFAKSNEYEDVKDSILKKKNVVVEAHDVKYTSYIRKDALYAICIFFVSQFFPIT